MNSKSPWEYSAPEQHDMNPAILQQMKAAMTANNLRSCLILKEEKCVFEYYRDSSIITSVQKINSCTKSVLSALIGIAIDQGLIPSLDTPIISYFPMLAEDRDVRKQQITIDHLLTMSAGFEWSEFQTRVSFPAMTRSSDWVKYTLEQPLADAPGSRMVYNSGCSQLLAAILKLTSKMDVASYAEQHLFAPLGIEHYLWEQDPQGLHIGGFGLHLTTQDMAKFGLLFLQDGLWTDKPLLPAAWIQQSSLPLFYTYAQVGHYGRHWWVSSFPESAEEDAAAHKYFFALGYGGQYIIVLPSQQLVAVFTSDRYGKTKQPADYFHQYIIPSLQLRSV